MGHVIGRTTFGHVDVRCERRTAELSQVDLRNHMLDCTLSASDRLGRREFMNVPLAIAKAQRIGLETLLSGEREHCGRIEPTTEQDNCWPSKRYRI